MDTPYAIEMLNITKRFPGIIANDNITLQLKRGEIHALLGENGAGKSTLMSVLFGLYQAEEGIIKKDGKVVSIKNPNDANDLGIGMVHQHFKLVQCFTVLENIILGVHEGSYAQEYAQNRGISYIVLETIKLGDANGDGYVNVNDVTAIQRHAAELELLEGINFHAADINGDGNVSVDDATELQRFLAEYVVDYPIGEVMTQ